MNITPVEVEQTSSIVRHTSSTMSSPDFLKPPGSSASNAVSTSKSAASARSEKARGKRSRRSSAARSNASQAPVMSRSVIRTVPPWASTEDLSPNQTSTSQATSPLSPFAPKSAHSNATHSVPDTPTEPATAPGTSDGPSDGPSDGHSVPSASPPAVPPPNQHAPAENYIHRISIDGYEHWIPPEPKKRRTFRQYRRQLGLGRSLQGRKWDHKRTSEPVVVMDHALPRNWERSGTQSSWRDFKEATRYPRTGMSSQVDIEALNRLQPNFNNPAMMRPYDELTDSARPRGSSMSPPGTAVSGNNAGASNNNSAELPYTPYESDKTPIKVPLRLRIWETMINHYMVPLLCRVMALSASAISMAVAVRIFKVSSQIMASTQASQSQSLVVIIVDAIAVPYICYMTYDEYTGKPVGLRSPTHKVMLILLDIIFIIFKSASTSLAFEYLVSHANDPDGDGFEDPRGPELLRLSRALAAFVVLGLFAWTLTLVINVLRVVNRLTTVSSRSRTWA